VSSVKAYCITRRRGSLLRAAAVVIVTHLAVATLHAQQPSYPTAWRSAILSRPDIKGALAHLERGFPKQVDEWITIAEMPGKSGSEEKRGAYVQQVMEQEGLQVSVDSLGNVTGVRKGAGGGPSIVLAAHLDIVHGLDVNLQVRREGDTLRAPGIFDNSASVANMLATIRALNAGGIRTKGDLIFVATVREEIGLRGIDFWLDHHPRPDLLIGLDGGLGPVAYGALGIYWTRYVFTSEGSHTATSRGKPTPVKALAEAIDGIYKLGYGPLPDGAVINVGQVHGGVIFNGVPEELYFTTDLRSTDPVLLDSLDRSIGRLVADAAAREKVGLRVERELQNGAGGTTAMLAPARAHPLVQTAVDVQQHLGIRTGPPGAGDAIAIGSTDANMGVIRRIPSIAIGRSYGGNQHTIHEWADWKSALPATKLLLLLAVTMSDSSPRTDLVP